MGETRIGQARAELSQWPSHAERSEAFWPYDLRLSSLEGSLMLFAIAGACLCVFVNAGFLFGTFCLVLTHAVQVKQFPNKINEQVSVCFVVMVAWGLSAAL